MKISAVLLPILRGPMTPLPSRSLTGQRGVARAMLPRLAPLRLFTSPSLPKRASNQLRNEMITAPLVRLVDPESGQLAGPFSPADILAKVNQRHFALVQVTAGNMEGDSDSWTLEQLPVCRLIDRHDEYQKMREAKKRPTPQTKEMQISWVIAPPDLGVKINKVHQYLKKGHKVMITMSGKRGSRRAAPGTAEYSRRTGVFDSVVNAACTCDGQVIGIIKDPPNWRFQRSQVDIVIIPHNPQ